MGNDTARGSDLRERTRTLALRVLRLCQSLPKDPETLVLRKQICRSGTSVGAQYREACRARSRIEFRSKMRSALQELDETTYWLELLIDSGRVAKARVANLMKECDELIRIFVASINTSARKAED